MFVSGTSTDVKETISGAWAHTDTKTGTPDSSGSPSPIRPLPDESGVPVGVATAQPCWAGQTNLLPEAGFDSLELGGLQRLTALVMNGFGDFASVVLHELNLRVHYFPEELSGGLGIDLESGLAR